MNDERQELDALLAKIHACADEGKLEAYLLEYTHADRGYGPWDWFCIFGHEQGIEEQHHILRHPLIGQAHLATLLGHYENIEEYEMQLDEEERDFPGRAEQLRLHQAVIELLSDPRWSVLWLDDQFDYYTSSGVSKHLGLGHGWNVNAHHEKWFDCGFVLGALCNPVLSGQRIQELYDDTDGHLNLKMGFNALGKSVAELVAAHPNTPPNVIDGMIEHIDGLFDDPDSARSVLLSRGDLTDEQILAVHETRRANPGTAP